MNPFVAVGGICGAVLSIAAIAEQTASKPPKVTGEQIDCGSPSEGSDSVLAEGKPALRFGDGSCVLPVDGSANVFIGGKPALKVGDVVMCSDGNLGRIVGGASTVFVNGRPMATADSRLEGCGVTSITPQPES